MKKVYLTLIPLFAISFLANCGGGSGGEDIPSVTYTITTATPGITINPTTYNPKDSPSGYEGIITVNDDIEEVLPRNLSSIVLDDDEKSSIKDYCEYKKISEQKASLKILEEDFINNVEFSLELQPKIPWYEDTEYLNSLERNDVDRVNPDGTVGVVNTLMVNEVEQKVRLIGVDEDKDENGNNIHTTWEFANLLSDEDGYSIATYWNDVAEEEGSNANYMDSTIRAVLNGNNYEGSSTAEIHWYRWYGNPIKCKRFAVDYEGKSVLDMLPQEFEDVLKKPSKNVYIYNYSKLPDPGWEEKEVNDKLFLLSSEEMRVGETSYDCAYSYYKNANPKDCDFIRIKHQVNNNGARNSFYTPSDGKFKDFNKECYAGYDDETAPLKDIKGGVYYLRSVNSLSNTPDGDAAYIECDGDYSFSVSPEDAMPIVPAFCI